MDGDVTMGHFRGVGAGQQTPLLRHWIWICFNNNTDGHAKAKQNDGFQATVQHYQKSCSWKVLSFGQKNLTNKHTNKQNKQTNPPTKQTTNKQQTK